MCIYSSKCIVDDELDVLSDGDGTTSNDEEVGDGVTSDEDTDDGDFVPSSDEEGTKPKPPPKPPDRGRSKRSWKPSLRHLESLQNEEHNSLLAQAFVARQKLQRNSQIHQKKARLETV